jgi:hypothetical protein
MILIYYALVVPSVLPLTLVLKLLVSKLSVCLLTLQLIIIVVYIHLLQWTLISSANLDIMAAIVGVLLLLSLPVPNYLTWFAIPLLNVLPIVPTIQLIWIPIQVVILLDNVIAILPILTEMPFVLEIQVINYINNGSKLHNNKLKHWIIKCQIKLGLCVV